MACRRWLILSGPIVRLARCRRYQATLAAEPAKNDTPAPAKVILEVEANRNGRFGLPASSASPRMSSAGISSSVRWCTAYALSQKIRKSSVAVGISSSARVTSSV